MFVFYILRFLLWKPDKKSRFLNAHLDYLLTVLTPYFILYITSYFRTIMSSPILYLNVAWIDIYDMYL